LGQKVHPIGFRLGIVHDWQAKWYSDNQFAQLLKEDIELRRAIQARYHDAGISRVEIERQAHELSLTIYTARPGIVIGRGGQRVEETRQLLEKLTGKRVRLNIQEIHQPELDAYLVARSIADQIERRVSYRRAMRQTGTRTMQAGSKGVKIICAGRLAGAEIARRESLLLGRVPLHTLRAHIDYGFAEAHTTLGRIGVKVWLYKGDLPHPSRRAEEAAPAEAPAEETVTEIIRASPEAESAPAETEDATTEEG
jgi:small subunit ribosomal protein S3